MTDSTAQVLCASASSALRWAENDDPAWDEELSLLSTLKHFVHGQCQRALLPVGLDGEPTSVP